MVGANSNFHGKVEIAEGAMALLLLEVITNLESLCIRNRDEGQDRQNKINLKRALTHAPPERNNIAPPLFAVPVHHRDKKLSESGNSLAPVASLSRVL